MILGSRNDVSPEEITACTTIANQVGNYSSSAGYSAYNWYGSQTTTSNIYTAAAGNGQTYSISYYIGHGGYVWEWHGIFYEQQWVITDDSGNYVYDKNIFTYTTCHNSKFVNLWSCEQADTLGGDHWSGVPFGMPYAWHHANNLSSNGYTSPDSGPYCFLGWNGLAPYISENVSGSYACYHFLSYFYYASLYDGADYSVKEALDYASQAVWQVNFGNSIIYTGTGDGNIRVFGNGNMHISSHSAGGGGCPYVSTWNGLNYVLDNNILVASEDGNGTDVVDYYKLEQSLTPIYATGKSSLYSIKVHEFENEQDHIDQIRLLAVEHARCSNIAVTSNGEILTYGKTRSPLSCIDRNGSNRLSEVATVNGNIDDPSTYFQGCEGDTLMLNFGNVSGSNANLIFRDDQKCDDICIDVQIPSGGGGWQTVEVLHPRSFWSTEAINMEPYVSSDGNLIVRLLWTAPHKLDFVGLDTTSQSPVKVTSATLLCANHSELGDVRQSLLNDDEDMVQLVSGQEIIITFLLPNKVNNAARDFILITNGYYYLVN